MLSFSVERRRKNTSGTPCEPVSSAPRRVVPAVGFCVGGPIYSERRAGLAARWVVSAARPQLRFGEPCRFRPPWSATCCDRPCSARCGAIRRLFFRERRMPRLLAEYAPGASKHLLESCSLAAFPLLICGTQIGRLKTVTVRLLRPESAYQ